MTEVNDMETTIKGLRENLTAVTRKAELFEGAFNSLRDYNQHNIETKHEVGKVCADCQTHRTMIAKYYGPLKEEGFVK